MVGIGLVGSLTLVGFLTNMTGINGRRWTGRIANQYDRYKWCGMSGVSWTSNIIPLI